MVWLHGAALAVNVLGSPQGADAVDAALRVEELAAWGAG